MEELVQQFKDLNNKFLRERITLNERYDLIYGNHLYSFREIWKHREGERIRGLVKELNVDYVNFCWKFEYIFDSFLFDAYNETYEKIRVRDHLENHWSNRCYTHLIIRDALGKIITDLKIPDVLITLEMVFRNPSSEMALFVSEFEIFWLGTITFKPVLLWDNE